MERRLAAILAADVAGYSRLMGHDESGTLDRLNALHRELVQPAIATHGGRIVKLMGDGLLAEFSSVVKAVDCAISIQESMARREPNAEQTQRVNLRMGINLGDIIYQRGDIHGDGVNIAARLEALAEPGGICISSTVREQLTGKVNLNFRDAGDQWLKNIDRPVRVFHAVPSTDGPMASPRPAASAALPDKPSVAVLPFENRSGDPDQAYFSDGITDDIITELARYDELFVIARHSAFAYRERPFDIREIARRLGVQTVMEGSVRRAGNRVRISANLIDAASGSPLWSDRFDRDLEDIFALQDEITGVIVNTLVGQLTRLHNRRALARGSGALHAHDHALRAMELVWKMGPDGIKFARSEAQRAVDIDPQFARAHALIAWTHISEGTNLWGPDPTECFERAHQAAMKAVAADELEPWAHCSLGWAHLWRNRDHAQGLAALRRSTELNPSNAHFRGMLCWALGYAGEPEAALAEMDLAMRLNPHHPTLYLVFLGRALFHLDRPSEALVNLQRVIATSPKHTHALALVAACYAATGMMDRARETVRHMKEVSPAYTLNYVRRIVPYASDEDLDYFADMLEKAGLGRL